MTAVTQSDRPNSVCNRCVIELFDDVFLLSCCPFDISVGMRVFFHRTESDLFLFSLDKLSGNSVIGFCLNTEYRTQSRTNVYTHLSMIPIVREVIIICWQLCPQ